MSYFLKKTRKKKGLYLQIYESYRDPDTRQPKNRSVKALGYVQDLTSDQIPDPITYYGQEVARMNEKRRDEKQAAHQKQIGKRSPVRNMGHFPLAIILRHLEVKEDLERLASLEDFSFDWFSCFQDLILAWAIRLESSHQTLAEDLLALSADETWTSGQICRTLAFAGREYAKIIEIFTRHLRDTYDRQPAPTFFEKMYFYFETGWSREGIGTESPGRDSFIQKAETGLWLDPEGIPLGMELVIGDSDNSHLPDTGTADKGSQSLCFKEIAGSFQDLEARLDTLGIDCRDEDQLKGCLLMVYLANVLIRLLQVLVLENRYDRKQIADFFADCKVVKINEHTILNVSTINPVIQELAEKMHLPVTNYTLKPSELKRILEF